MITVGVDPGVHACGVGVMSGNTLIAAALVTTDEGRGTSPGRLAFQVWEFVARHLRARASFEGMGRFVIEYPQAYEPGQQKGDQNDLIRVALVAGAVAGVAWDRAQCTAELILPRVWKGTVKKEAMTERIENRLEIDEKFKIEPVAQNLRHNVIDGVGIALWATGRLERRRVYD